MTSNGSKYHIVLWDLDQHLRSIVKYGEDTHGAVAVEMADQIREKLHELLNEYNVQLV